MNDNLSRRSFLKGSAVLGGITAVSFSQLFGFSQVFGQSDGDDVETILNLAATAETLACTHYWAALTSGGMTLDEGIAAYFRAALDSELQHLEFLNANGGVSLVSEFFTPVGVYSDLSMFASVSEVAETAFIAAYLAATRRTAELGNPLFAATAAQVGGVEAQHLALVRQIGGSLPNHVSLMRTLFFNVSDAVPSLQPFLEGGNGFEGPTAYPGADTIRSVIGSGGVEAVQPFTDPSLFPEVMATGGACMVMARMQNVNIRAGAGIDMNVIGTLASGQSAEADGQTTGTDGFVWYRLVQGGFVRSDAVNVTDMCASLPAV